MTYIIVAIIVVAAGYLAYKITSSANERGKTVGCGSCGKGAMPLHPSKKDYDKLQACAEEYIVYKMLWCGTFFFRTILTFLDIAL